MASQKTLEAEARSNGTTPAAAAREIALTEHDDLDCFVMPAVERLYLAAPLDRYWVEIARELTVWQRDTVTASQIRSVRQEDGSIQAVIDTARGRFTKLKTYLQDWNLTQQDGKRVPLNDATLKNLRPQLADAIEAAIDTHVDGLAALLTNADPKAEPPR